MSEMSLDYRDKLALATRIQAHLGEYIACLDNDRFEEWPDFFAEKCTYRITSAENWKKGLPISLVYCNSRGMLVDRVQALRSANIYEDHAYRHVLSPTVVRGQGDGLVEAHTGFVVLRIMGHGAVTVFATGQYIDRLSMHDPDQPPQFVEKIVVCDSSVVDTLLVLPL